MIPAATLTLLLRCKNLSTENSRYGYLHKAHPWRRFADEMATDRSAPLTVGQQVLHQVELDVGLQLQQPSPCGAAAGGGGPAAQRPRGEPREAETAPAPIPDPAVPGRTPDRPRWTGGGGWWSSRLSHWLSHRFSHRSSPWGHDRRQHRSQHCRQWERGQCGSRQLKRLVGQWDTCLPSLPGANLYCTWPTADGVSSR